MRLFNNLGLNRRGYPQSYPQVLWIKVVPLSSEGVVRLDMLFLNRSVNSGQVNIILIFVCYNDKQSLG